MNKTLLAKTFRNILAAAVYILLVSQVMQNGSKLFGKEDTMLMPFVFLMLFSLSAAVVGGLVFGQSVYLFFDNKKPESITAALYSIGWLALFTLLGVIILITIK